MSIEFIERKVNGWWTTIVMKDHEVVGEIFQGQYKQYMTTSVRELKSICDKMEGQNGN